MCDGLRGPQSLFQAMSQSQNQKEGIAAKEKNPCKQLRDQSLIHKMELPDGNTKTYTDYDMLDDYNKQLAAINNAINQQIKDSHKNFLV
jgi:hypothetical protein